MLSSDVDVSVTISARYEEVMIREKFVHLAVPASSRRWVTVRGVTCRGAFPVPFPQFLLPRSYCDNALGLWTHRMKENSKNGIYGEIIVSMDIGSLLDNIPIYALIFNGVETGDHLENIHPDCQWQFETPTWTGYEFVLHNVIYWHVRLRAFLTQEWIAKFWIFRFYNCQKLAEKKKTDHLRIHSPRDCWPLIRVRAIFPPTPW